MNTNNELLEKALAIAAKPMQGKWIRLDRLTYSIPSGYHADAPRTKKESQHYSMIPSKIRMLRLIIYWAKDSHAT